MAASALPHRGRARRDLPRAAGGGRHRRRPTDRGGHRAVAPRHPRRRVCRPGRRRGHRGRRPRARAARLAVAAPPRRPPRRPVRGPGRAAAGRGGPDRGLRRRAARPVPARRDPRRRRPRRTPARARPGAGRAGLPHRRRAAGPRLRGAGRPGGRAAVPRRPSSRSEDDGGGSTSEAERWRAAGFEGPGRPLRVVEGRPALRWAIDIAAPLAPRGRRWGDDPFARSLAAALERRGQWVTVDHPETRARGSRDHDDVVLVLRGLDPVAPTPADAGVAARLLWIISHPGRGHRRGVRAVRPGPRRRTRLGPAAHLRTGGARSARSCSARTRPASTPAWRSPTAVPRCCSWATPGGAAAGGAGRLDARLPLTLHGDGWADLVDPPWSPGCTCRTTRWARSTPPPAWCSATTGTTCARSASSPTGPSTCSPGRPAPVRRRGRPQRPLRRPVRPAGADLAGPGRPPAARRARLARGLPRRRGRFRAAERVVAEHSFDARAGQLLDAALTVVGPTDLDSSP